VGLARETARLAVRGEFIQHLDSDDLLYPEKFARAVAGLREHSECDVSYSWSRVKLEDGTFEEAPAKRTGERFETMFPAMLQSRWWHTNTPLYRASLLDRAGPWLALRNEEDWEYDARVAALGVRLHYVPEWGSEFRHHDQVRLSASGLDPNVLRDRARAHTLIFEHADRAGIGPETPEMQSFARELFLLARQCGAAGLGAESEMLFAVARKASGPDGNRLQFRAYRAVTRILGWPLTGKLACISDRLRW
jgi:hypothetical protein